MIMVNVLFRELNKDYDFKVDGEADIEKVTDEMVRMIGQTEHIPMAEQSGLFFLCDKEKYGILNPRFTLSDYGIGNGDYLMLI